MATSDQTNTEHDGDQPTAEDLLGFREHAERLADEISHFDPNLPMVVGIEGKWGEGKTSFFLMMEAYWRRQNKLAPEWPRLNAGWWWPHKFFCALSEYILFIFESVAYFVDGCVGWVKNSLSKLPREERQIRLVKFDPWWFSGKEKLLERFLDEIKAKEPFCALFAKNMLNSLKDSLSKHRSPWNKLISAIVVAVLPLMLPLIFSKTTVLTEEQSLELDRMMNIALPGLSVLTFVLISLLIERLLNFIAPVDMEKKRARLEHKLRRSSIQRIVIVDDIDRLPDDELQELFRVIKSVAAMPNIVYVLLYDRTAVAGALDKLHANRGEQFLEKIVQLSNRLPIPTKTATRTAVYHFLSSLPAIKNLMSQMPTSEPKQKDFDCKILNFIYKQLNPSRSILQPHSKSEYQDGLNLIVSALIPHLRQAKRIANVVKIGYREDLEINILLFVFLEALRLHNTGIWSKLREAMIDYENYPSATAIINSQNHEKTTNHLSNKENEWMIKHGLMSEQYGPCPPFAGMPEKLIECITYFTGLALPGAKKAYGSLLFYIPESVRLDDQRKYCQELFEKYLQGKLAEGMLSVECVLEELLTLSSVTEITQFINDKKSKFGDFIIDSYYIRAYLRGLKTEELMSDMSRLYGLPGLVAASAENCYLSQVNLKSQADFIKCCEIIFHEFLFLSSVRKPISSYVLDQLVEQEEQLLLVAEKEHPLFYFKLQLGLKNTSPDDPIYLKNKQAVLDKYPPQIALQIFSGKDKGLGGKIFEKFLLDTCTDAEEERFSNWLCSSPKNSELDVLLLDWMIASLEKERDNSRLPLLPELAHLIEPLKRKLEPKGNNMALEHLKVILERSPNKTDP